MLSPRPARSPRQRQRRAARHARGQPGEGLPRAPAAGVGNGNGSGSVSSYSIGNDGTLTLLQSIAAMEPSVLAGVNSVAGDSWVSPDGKYLYATYLGADKIVSYAIDAGTGALSKVGEVIVGTSSKLGLQGMAGV